MPPCSGGLWDGVMMIPSAISSALPWALWRKIARDTLGVGTNPRCASTRVVMRLPTNTSIATCKAGCDKACVSCPI